MLPRDWAFVFAAALLLVQAGCNRGGNAGNAQDSAALPGVTGTGTSGAAPSPGSGLNGGLGTTQSMGSSPAGSASQSSGSAPVHEGSKNLTPHSSVGNR
jgi:hypothetical protein